MCLRAIAFSLRNTSKNTSTSQDKQIEKEWNNFSTLKTKDKIITPNVEMMSSYVL